jgi:hypothetical protein
MQEPLIRYTTQRSQPVTAGELHVQLVSHTLHIHLPSSRLHLDMLYSWPSHVSWQQTASGRVHVRPIMDFTRLAQFIILANAILLALLYYASTHRRAHANKQR